MVPPNSSWCPSSLPEQQREHVRAVRSQQSIEGSVHIDRAPQSQTTESNVETRGIGRKVVSISTESPLELVLGSRLKKSHAWEPL